MDKPPDDTFQGNGLPPLTGSSDLPVSPADEVIDGLVKVAFSRASQFKPLEGMAIGRAVIHASPAQYEAAFEDLLQSGLLVSLEDILNLRTADQQSLLDLMVQVKSEQAYFAGTMIYLLTIVALSDIKNRFPFPSVLCLARQNRLTMK